jgi:hypothetical protein
VRELVTTTASLINLPRIDQTKLIILNRQGQLAEAGAGVCF